MRRKKNECKSLLCPAAPNKLNQKGGKPPELSDIKDIINGLSLTIQEKKGEGVHGVVYKVKSDDGGEAAYKFITKATHDLVDDYLEIGILQLITNIQSETSYFPELYDWGFVKSKNILWMGIELVDTDLNQLINRQQVAGPFSIDMIHKISFQIARGLEFLHKHEFAHCDLKPANIGINKDNSIRLLDFGLMQYLHDGEPADGLVVSRNYRAPEISYTYNAYDYMSTYTTAVDMWSLGCIIAKMFIGESLLHSKKDYIDDARWLADMAHSDEFQINKCIDLCLQLGQFKTMKDFIKEIKDQPHINCRRPGNTKADVFEKLSNMIIIRNIDITVTSMKDILLSDLERRKAEKEAARIQAEVDEAVGFEPTAKEKEEERKYLLRVDLINGNENFIDTVLAKLFEFNFEKRYSAEELLDYLGNPNKISKRRRQMAAQFTTSYKPIKGTIDSDLLQNFQKCFPNYTVWRAALARGEEYFPPTIENVHKTIISLSWPVNAYKRLAFAKVLYGGKSPLFKDLDPKITECVIKYLI